MSEAEFDFVPGRSALLISFPHSGVALPEAMRARLTPAALAVPDTDWHVPHLYESCAGLGASLLIARNSRYVVDLNRPPDGAPLYPGKTETGLCPTRTFAGEPVYRPGEEPGADEIRARIQDHWNPYHAKLAETVDTIRTQQGYCILWDAHSIRSKVPAFFEGRLPDLNVGTADGSSCSRLLTDRVMHTLASQSRFTSILNGRFKGGYITRRYGDPARGVNAVQLEIAQRAYMDESAPIAFDPAIAFDLKSLLRSLLADVLSA